MCIVLLCYDTTIRPNHDTFLFVQYTSIRATRTYSSPSQGILPDGTLRLQQMAYWIFNSVSAIPHGSLNSRSSSLLMEKEDACNGNSKQRISIIGLKPKTTSLSWQVRICAVMCIRPTYQPAWTRIPKSWSSRPNESAPCHAGPPFNIPPVGKIE